MKTIHARMGQEIIVDNEDYQGLNQHAWNVSKGRNVYYARRKSPKINGKQTAFLLHRVIMVAKTGESVDHINQNGLDHRKENLRICTNRENQQNARIRKDNVSGYRGVNLDRGTGKWKAQIRAKGKRIYLGLHATPEEAAQAYDNAAVANFGEFAHLNFPKEATNEA